MVTLTKNFDLNLRRDHQKIFLWAARIWVGRRQEPILGYVPKNDEKNNLGGFTLTGAYIFFYIKFTYFKFELYTFQFEFKYFNLNFTYFNLNFTYFNLNLTCFNLNFTQYFNLNLRYFNLNFTYFNLNFTHLNLKFTHFNLKFTYFNFKLKRRSWCCLLPWFTASLWVLFITRFNITSLGYQQLLSPWFDNYQLEFFKLTS